MPKGQARAVGPKAKERLDKVDRKAGLKKGAARKASNKARSDKDNKGMRTFDSVSRNSYKQKKK